MSLDAIKQISKAETDAQLSKTEQVANAKKMVADVEKKGQESLEQLKVRVEEENQRLYAEAEESAKSECEKILAEADADCEKLTQSAKSKLKDAQAIIVRRVVNG